jgi:imidazolonepropionase-like amidohydrolase
MSRRTPDGRRSAHDGPRYDGAAVRPRRSPARPAARSAARAARAARLAGWVLALATAAAAPVTAQAAQAAQASGQTIALVGGTVIDGTGAAPVADGVVVVTGERIACVGTAADCPVPDDARRVDARGRWIIPGLIDAHVHYSQTGWADGRPDALDMRERFPYDQTIAWLRSNPHVLGRSYLCSGVTATFDVGGYPWTWELRDRSAASTTMPHVEAAGPLLSTRDHWLNLPAERQFIHMADDQAVEAGARYLVAQGTSAIKVWFIVGAASDTTAARAGMEAIAATAHDADIPLIVHATSLWAAKVAVANGAHLLVHSVEDRPVDDEFLRLARHAGTIYNPTLTVRDGYRQLAVREFDPRPYGDAIACVDPVTLSKAALTDRLPGALTGARRQAYVDRLDASAEIMAANLRRVRDAGIPIAMGTDAGNPLTLHGPTVYAEMEAMAHAGLSAMEVLVASTLNAARAMGRDADLGTLEAGKRADLLLLTADPLAAVRNIRQLEAVMRNGRLHQRRDLEFR